MQQGVKSRRCILQRGVKSLCCVMQREVKSMIVAEIFKSSYCMLLRGDACMLYLVVGSQISPLNDAAGGQILLPHDAAGSSFGSGESSLKTLEDFLGP
jgi:hypothetical protein